MPEVTARNPKGSGRKKVDPLKLKVQNFAYIEAWIVLKIVGLPESYAYDAKKMAHAKKLFKKEIESWAYAKV